MKTLEELNKKHDPSSYDVMVDIETLDTSPTSITFSIGYIIFKAEKTISGSIKFCKRYNIEINGQLELGLTKSEDTQRFWKKPENAEAFDFLQTDTIPLKTALTSLTKDLASIRTKYFWAKSPSFDFVILENAYKACGLDKDQVPWKFWNLRDIRTVEWVFKEYHHIKRDFQSEKKEILSLVENISDHDPLFDCAKQIMEIIHFDNMMKGGDEESSAKGKKFIKFELSIDAKTPHQSRLSLIPE